MQRKNRNVKPYAVYRVTTDRKHLQHECIGRYRSKRTPRMLVESTGLFGGSRVYVVADGVQIMRNWA